MPSRYSGELDDSSERPWDVWTETEASGCWKSVTAPRCASFARPDRCIHSTLAEIRYSSVNGDGIRPKVQGEGLIIIFDTVSDSARLG